jgi:hypothetical protein
MAWKILYNYPMTTNSEEGEELTAILHAVERYNAKSAAENRLTRLTLLLAVGDEESIALLAGPPVKAAPVDSRKLH